MSKPKNPEVYRGLASKHTSRVIINRPVGSTRSAAGYKWTLTRHKGEELAWYARDRPDLIVRGVRSFRWPEFNYSFKHEEFLEFKDAAEAAAFYSLESELLRHIGCVRIGG